MLSVLSNTVTFNIHTNLFLFKILIKTFIKYIHVYFDLGFIILKGTLNLFVVGKT